MYSPDLPTYLVFYLETIRGSSIDMLTMDEIPIICQGISVRRPVVLD
jgi:hypothetical protein